MFDNEVAVSSWHFLLKLCAMIAEGCLGVIAAQRLLKPHKDRIKQLMPFLLFSLTITLPSWIGDENTLLLLPFFIGVILFSYQGTLPARLVTAIVLYLMLVPVNMILDTAVNWRRWALDSLPVLAIKVAYAGALCLFVLRLTRDGSRPELSERLWTLCGILSLAPFIATLSFSIWNGFDRSPIDAAQLRLAFTLLPFVVFSAGALLIAVVVLSNYERLEQSARLAQMRELYYDGIKARETEVRTLRHDLSNHLAVVQGFLENGDAAGAQSYLAQLTESPALHGVRRICENETANVVLSCKLEQMEQSGLCPDFLVSLPQKLPLSDTDLSALLGNALDNSMEAAVQAKDKTIRLRLRADRGMLMLSVTNASATEPNKVNKEFVTNKKDSALHGFGIRSMQQMAEQHQGTMSTDFCDGFFELTVCLPLEQGED